MKLPPAAIDVDAGITDVLPGIELTSVPLPRAIDSSRPQHLADRARYGRHAAAWDHAARPISLQLDWTTIGGALQAVAAKAGIGRDGR